MHSKKLSPARREAELLFFRLLNQRPDTNREGGLIHIIYPERFRKGTCLISALIPLGGMTVRDVARITEAHKGYYYAPVILNTKDGVFLRLIWRFQQISGKERAKLLKNAKDLARWTERIFHRQAVLFPASGSIGVRIKLHALR